MAGSGGGGMFVAKKCRQKRFEGAEGEKTLKKGENPPTPQILMLEGNKKFSKLLQK